jgi:hypothetical protein
MLGQSAKIAVIVASMFAYARAEETLSPKSVDRGVLVLHNGEILEGRITHAEGAYVVDLPDGQIRLKDADVDLVCRSLEDGYQRKRTAIQLGNVHDHLELAQWCLRHGLLGPAAAELADAKVADPKNPMVAALQHRLKMAAEPPPLPERHSPSAAGPSNEELDRMVRGLPRGVVETFTQSVQPVLMNHCMGSGCHGLQSGTGMQLSRISSSKSPSRRFTQRNLYAVLQYVNQEDPLASKLLSAAGGPHGPVQHAIFSEREAAQYRRLSDWACQIAQREPLEEPATVTPPAEAATSNLAEMPPRVLSQEAKKAHPLAASDHGQQGRKNNPRMSGTVPSKDFCKPTPTSPNQPADPFDPETFNRQNASEKK